MKQQATIDGEVIRIGGSQKNVPIILQSEDEELSGCWAPRAIAKRLAVRLFEPVRLFGRGRWTRNFEGKWALDHFTVDQFSKSFAMSPYPRPSPDCEPSRRTGKTQL